LEQLDAGGDKMPLFMPIVDSKKAMEKAAKTVGGNVGDHYIICLSMLGAVELLVGFPDSVDFHVIPLLSPELKDLAWRRIFFLKLYMPRSMTSRDSHD
jgi:hypothetical protein